MPTLTPKMLHKAVKVGFSKMEHFRKARLRILSQFVTRFYGKQSTNAIDMEDKKASPLNLLYTAITTYIPNLVYADPKAKIRTHFMPYRGYANKLEGAVDVLAKRVKLRNTLRLSITDALMLCGWIKTGICDSGQTLDLDGEQHIIGEPYANRVDPDDMVVDPLARQLEEAIFIGHRFRIPKQALIESGAYDPDKVRKLVSRYDGAFRNEAATLSASQFMYGDANTDMEYVDLVELFLPHDKTIVTIPYDPTGGSDEIIREVDYDGPDTGPYHQLAFCPVPDNIMPVAPAMVWMDLHMMANRIARKLARQSERMKQILAFEGSSIEDAQEIVDADDGETVRVDNIDGIKEVRYGGANDDGYKYMDWVKQQFSEMANNVDLMSGQNANAPTATQAEMLQSNSSVRLSDMQNIVYHFTAEVMGDLAYFLHTDPLINLPLIQRQNGQDQQVMYTPEMRQGLWLDYNIDVQPMSMARQDPNVKLRRILEFCTNVIPAMAQAFQMLGPMFNIQAALAICAREVGIEEADELINDPLLQQQVMAMAMAVQAPAKVQAGGGMGQPPAPSIGMPSQSGGFSFNLGQPNPGQMGPSGGIDTGAEQAAGQQEGSAELQKAYPSVNRIAARLAGAV